MYFGTTTIVYGITALLSLALLLGYLILLKKTVNLLLLYVAVFVVNLGYFSLAISRTVPEAMLANRIAYLGSVFLPLFMLLIIQDACRIRWHKAALGVLIGISVCVFLLAASGGYCGLYYKEVSLRFAGGAAVLDKVYGPLHVVYLVYLVGYFALMIGIIVYAVLRKKIASAKHAAVLAALVLGNIAIWFVEQRIDLDFEFLAVSYIVTELFLLLLYDLLQEYNTMQESLENRDKEELPKVDPVPAAEVMPAEETDELIAEEAQETVHEENPEVFYTAEEQLLTQRRVREIMEKWPGMQMLTVREAEVLRALLINMRRRDIADMLFVSENTVKKHTSNIFAKLGVSNRRELCARLDEETPR